MSGGTALGRSSGGTPLTESSSRFWVHVLATTPDGTRAALIAARRLTDGVGARITLLVPRIASHGLAGSATADDQAALVDRYTSLATEVGAKVTVLVCVCWRPADVVRSLLGRASLVFVGGRCRRFWPSAEQRLASRLVAEGFAIVFAPIDAETADLGLT